MKQLHFCARCFCWLAVVFGPPWPRTGLSKFPMIVSRLFLVALLATLPLAAQGQFSKTVLFPNAKSCAIAAVTVDQDTIVCFGNLYGTEEQKWGVFLAKFDSSGNFLQITTDFDSLQAQTVESYSQVLRCSDGGYIGGGSQGGHQSAVYKFSHSGQLEWKSLYREGDTQVITARSVAEVSDGYLIFGWHSVNYDTDNFCMKISRTGEFVWFNKDIGVLNEIDLSLGCFAKKGNNYVVGSGRNAINPNPQHPLEWAQSYLVEVDSLGNVQWEWYNPVEDKETGASSLVYAGEGNVIYTTVRYYPNDLNGEDFQVMLRKVNTETGATLWHKALSPVNLTFESGWLHLLPSPDGSGFDAVGFRQHYQTGFVISGWAAHLDWEGEMLWQRYDTIYVDSNLWVSANKLYNLAHLSSGAIVAVGDVLSATPYGHNEGWLIKWPADGGCQQPGTCALVSTHEGPPASGPGWQRWDLHPNPARGHTWLSAPEGWGGQAVSVLVSDPSGRSLGRQECAAQPGGQYKVSLEGLRPGLYFYEVVAGGQSLAAGRLVVLY